MKTILRTHAIRDDNMHVERISRSFSLHKRMCNYALIRPVEMSFWMWRSFSFCFPNNIVSRIHPKPIWIRRI